MKRSFSNIAWSSDQDEQMFRYLQEHGFSGLEIAPTRLFPVDPYEHLEEASDFAVRLQGQYGLLISSMQSIWYGRSESVFGTAQERKSLIDYTMKAVDFAVKIGCPNLVFGCPKNRNIPEGTGDEKAYEMASSFFEEIAKYAWECGVTIALEPNPKIYGTNFINSTNQAFEFVKNLDLHGLSVNVDLGTVIENNEDLRVIADNLSLVSHIHISEPYLEMIKERFLHKELYQMLNDGGYDKYVSVEMKNHPDLELIKQTALYIKEIFT